MNAINPYLIPGTYEERENPGHIVVATEVANWVFDAPTHLHELKVQFDALVISRPLIGKMDVHEVYATPLIEFTRRFKKI